MMPMIPYWKDGDTARYRLHLLDKNYSVKITEDVFGDLEILTDRNSNRMSPSIAPQTLPKKRGSPELIV